MPSRFKYCLSFQKYLHLFIFWPFPNCAVLSCNYQYKTDHPTWSQLNMVTQQLSVVKFQSMLVVPLPKRSRQTATMRPVNQDKTKVKVEGPRWSLTLACHFCIYRSFFISAIRLIQICEWKFMSTMVIISCSCMLPLNLNHKILEHESAADLSPISVPIGNCSAITPVSRLWLHHGALN